MVSGLPGKKLAFVKPVTVIKQKLYLRKDNILGMPVYMLILLIYLYKYLFYVFFFLFRKVPPPELLTRTMVFDAYLV